MKRRNEKVVDVNSNKRQKLPKDDDEDDEFPATSRDNKTSTSSDSKKVNLI